MEHDAKNRLYQLLAVRTRYVTYRRGDAGSLAAEQSDWSWCAQLRCSRTCLAYCAAALRLGVNSESLILLGPESQAGHSPLQLLSCMACRREHDENECNEGEKDELLRQSMPVLALQH